MCRFGSTLCYPDSWPLGYQYSSKLVDRSRVCCEHDVSMGWFADNSVRFYQLPCGSASARSLAGQSLESASRASDGDCDDVSRFRERVRESVEHVRSLVERVRVLADHDRAQLT